MKRRDFITLLGTAAASCPLAVGAQQATLPVIAFINAGSPDAMTDRVADFQKGLSETGYSEGQSVSAEYHWLEGDDLRLPAVLDDV